MQVRFLSVGDRALAVEFGDRIDRALSGAVLRLDAVIRAEQPTGVVETVPTFRSLLVHYDPLATSRADLERTIELLLDCTEDEHRTGRLWRIPVCYEGEFAPDLSEVARLTGLPPEAVVALHSGERYHVYMLGFLPGFPYLGDLPAALALPRRADPRRAGSRRLDFDRDFADRDLSLRKPRWLAPDRCDADPFFRRGAHASGAPCRRRHGAVRADRPRFLCRDKPCDRDRRL